MNNTVAEDLLQPIILIADDEKCLSCRSRKPGELYQNLPGMPSSHNVRTRALPDSSVACRECGVREREIVRINALHARTVEVPDEPAIKPRRRRRMKGSTMTEGVTPAAVANPVAMPSAPAAAPPATASPAVRAPDAKPYDADEAAHPYEAASGDDDSQQSAGSDEGDIY